MNSDNIEISSSVIEKEYVILTTANSSFFSFVTNAGQLLVFSTRTTKIVKVFVTYITNRFKREYIMKVFLLFSAMSNVVSW